MKKVPPQATPLGFPQSFRFGVVVLTLALIMVFTLGFCGSVRCATLNFNQTPPVRVPHDSPAAALEGAFTQVAKAVSPAVVNISIEWTERIETLVPNFGNLQDFFNGMSGFPGLVPREATRKMQALGSGFIITPDGYILTNGHVVGKADKITVLLENGQTFPAQVVGKDEKVDIALLKIDAGKELPCVVLGDSGAIEVGQWAIAIGNPFGLDHTMTSGIISAKGRSVNINENSSYASYIQTDASINPGNSGGPLCNLQGEVVGINTAIFSQTGGSIGIGFAVPSNVARKVANDMARQGHVIRAGLGINSQPLDSKMAKSFGLSDTKGVLVSNIGKDSAAEKAGMKVGDIILEIDGENVSNPSDLIARLYAKSPGDHVSLSVLRDKRKVNTDAILQSLEENGTAVVQAPAPIEKPKKENEKFRLIQSMTYQDMTKDIRTQLDPSAPQGPVILTVAQGGMAAAAGLRPKDIVLQAGEKKITDAKSLDQALKNADLKKGLRLFIWRDGVTMYTLIQVNSN